MNKIGHGIPSTQVVIAALNEEEGIGLTIAEMVDTLGNPRVLVVDGNSTDRTGLLHCEMRKTAKDFGLADAYVLATATRLESKILTGDPHFKPLKEVIMIK